MGKAICFGITCLDILVPGLDPSEFYKETIRLNDFSYSTGGDAINEAVTLAKLGHVALAIIITGSLILLTFVFVFLKPNRILCVAPPAVV